MGCPAGAIPLPIGAKPLGMELVYPFLKDRPFPRKYPPKDETTRAEIR
jgi:hypothetical protein